MNAPRTGMRRRPVHGVLVLDKPLGLSSNQALQKAKWLLRAEKAGHTGTLDPMATGVLPLCFGAATKFSQHQLDADKAYAATIRLGVRTTTGDAEGEVIETRPVPTLTPPMLAEVARRFTGRQQQTPPMHSALKRDGRPLYEWARAGLDVPRVARDIEVFELQLSMANADGDLTAIEMVALVSKGTYIRTLGEAVGEALGCGGHLVALRRLRSGPFDLSHAMTLDQLTALDEPARLAALLPPECLLAGHVAVNLGADDAGRFLSGMRRRGAWADAPQVRVHGPSGHLLGTAHTSAGELIPDRLLSPLEISAMAEGPRELSRENP